MTLLMMERKEDEKVRMCCVSKMERAELLRNQSMENHNTLLDSTLGDDITFAKRAIQHCWSHRGCTSLLQSKETTYYMLQRAADP
jgi:hypothetical protein